MKVAKKFNTGTWLCVNIEIKLLLFSQDILNFKWFVLKLLLGGKEETHGYLAKP